MSLGGSFWWDLAWHFWNFLLNIWSRFNWYRKKKKYFGTRFHLAKRFFAYYMENVFLILFRQERDKILDKELKKFMRHRFFGGGLLDKNFFRFRQPFFKLILWLRFCLKKEIYVSMGDFQEQFQWIYFGCNLKFLDWKFAGKVKENVPKEDVSKPLKKEGKARVNACGLDPSPTSSRHLCGFSMPTILKFTPNSCIRPRIIQNEPLEGL